MSKLNFDWKQLYFTNVIPLYFDVQPLNTEFLGGDSAIFRFLKNYFFAKF